MRELIPWVLIILLIGGGVWYFMHQKEQYNQAKRSWEKHAEVLLSDISEMEKVAEKYRLEADTALKEADDEARRRIELENSLFEERLEHKRVLEGIAKLAPDQIVMAHHYHLGVDSSDIWLTERGLVFTIEASRENLKVLEKYEFCIKTEIPGYQILIHSADTENNRLRVTINGLRNTTNILGKEIIDLKAYGEGEHKLRLKAEKLVGFNLFSVGTVAVAVVAFLAGVVFVSVF